MGCLGRYVIIMNPLITGAIASSYRENLLLDDYSGAVGAYSVSRYLKKDFTNKAVVQLRRDSDGATSDFTPTEITDGTATSWAGMGQSARVNIWYDQSGNGNDISQSSLYNKPYLIISGTVQTLDGTKAAVDFDGTNDAIWINSQFPDIVLNNISVFCVAKYDTVPTTPSETLYSLGWTAGNGRFFMTNWSSSGYEYGYYFGYAGTWNALTGGPSADTSKHLFHSIAGSTLGHFEAWVDTTSMGYVTLSSNTTSGTYGLGGVNSTTSYAFDGKMSEFILYQSDQYSNIASIRSNVNSYYTLY